MSFLNVKLAKKSGYNPLPEEISPHGRVNPFTGLRWDARELYQSIKGGHEPRIVLRKVAEDCSKDLDNDEWKSVLDGAELVILSQGFVTNKVPIYDHDGLELELSCDLSGQLKVDHSNRLLLANGGFVKNLLGCGLGFGASVRCKLLDAERISGDARADGVDLYINVYGKSVLSCLLREAGGLDVTPEVEDVLEDT